MYEKVGYMDEDTDIFQEEGVPLTKEDIDILEEGRDCMICLLPCNELSTDLFLHNCKCIYYVHAECFREWRRVTDTDRICIICREELPYIPEEPLIVRRRHVLIFRNPGIDGRLDEHETTCCNKIGSYCFTLFVSVLIFIYGTICLGYFIRTAIQFRHV